MVSIVLESASWRCVEAVPPILFSLEGGTSVRRQRASLAAIEGRAAALEEGSLIVRDGDDLRLRHTLPERIDLRPLLRKHLRVTLRTAPQALGPSEQLLTIADRKGTILLLARFGIVQGEAHVIGETRLVAALSQRPGGPMVFGTRELQCLVRLGEHVTVREGGRDLVMYFLARTAAGSAAYAIVDRSLWR
jgi:hypothetical protein